MHSPLCVRVKFAPYKILYALVPILRSAWMNREGDKHWKSASEAMCSPRAWCLGAERASIYTRSTKFAYASVKYSDLMTTAKARARACNRNDIVLILLQMNYFMGKFLAKFPFLSFSRETGATWMERTEYPKSKRQKSQICAMQSQQWPNCWPALSHGVQLNETTESHPFWNRSSFRAKITTQFHFFCTWPFSYFWNHNRNQCESSISMRWIQQNDETHKKNCALSTAKSNISNSYARTKNKQEWNIIINPRHCPGWMTASVGDVLDCYFPIEWFEVIWHLLLCDFKKRSSIRLLYAIPAGSLLLLLRKFSSFEVSIQ